MSTIALNCDLSLAGHDFPLPDSLISPYAKKRRAPAVGTRLGRVDYSMTILQKAHEGMGGIKPFNKTDCTLHEGSVINA